MTSTERRARASYAECWDRFRMEVDDEERERLGVMMDSLQPLIADGPNDPRWVEFSRSLPGFVEYWASLPSIALAQLREQGHKI